MQSSPVADQASETATEALADKFPCSDDAPATDILDPSLTEDLVEAELPRVEEANTLRLPPTRALPNEDSALPKRTNEAADNELPNTVDPTTLRSNTEPMRNSPCTDALLPRRANELEERQLPNSAPLRTESSSPSLPDCRIDMKDPPTARPETLAAPENCVSDRTLNPPAKLESPHALKDEPAQQLVAIDRLLPSRPKLLVDTLLAICTRPMTDRPDPSRAPPYKDADVPIRVKDAILSELPNALFPLTLKELAI